MFSYGQNPWNGYSGSQVDYLNIKSLNILYPLQILHMIDTQRKTLERPDACPSQFYSLMKRCWVHDADQRPKFDEIFDMIPELMPQLLVAAVECQNIQTGRLQFIKGDTIILLDKW